MKKIDERIPGIGLPLMSVSQTRGVIRRSELTDAPQRAESLDVYKVCRRNDIVFNKMSIRAGAMGVAAEDGLVTYHYEVMRPREGIDPNFIAHLMKSSWFTAELIRRERGIGAGDQANVRTTEVPYSVLKTIDAYVPEYAEQRAIADYLDRETARIDTLIEEQQRLIEMLCERRWSVVERSVALLDWSTPLKAVALLIQTGPFGSQLKSDEYEDGGTPIINPSHIVAGEVAPDSRVAVGAGKAELLSRHALKEGDLVTARRGELGRCAVVRAPAVGFLCGTGSALVRFDRAVIEPAFAAIAFSSRRNRDALALASVGSTMDNLNSSIIGSLRIPVPTLEEQRGIVREINEQTAKIDALIEETEEFIRLSRERREALITAAVTGQVDVREAAV